VHSGASPRRARFSARKVKCATSRYLNRDDGRPATAATITAISIQVRPPLPGSGPARAHRRTSPTWARAGQPAATWSPPSSPASHPATGAETELAAQLNIPSRHLHTQLGEWTRWGFFTRTGFGTYRLNTPPAATSSTTEPDP
jgi:hypothetical protein